MKLNLGAGNRLMGDGWVNHDRWIHRPEITMAFDLEDDWPIEDNCCDEILAFDVLEHVLRPIKMIEKMWRICENNAVVHIHTCWAGMTAGAREVWRDPEHVRPFHELSFHYFDPTNGNNWYENYGKFYSPARFQVITVNPEPPDNILFVLRAIKESNNGVSGV